MLFLLSLPFLHGTRLLSRWGPPFLFHAPALIPFFLAKVRLSLTLTFFPFMVWCFGQTALFLFLLANVDLANLPTALCGTDATLSFSAGPVYSNISAEAFTILQVFCWSRQHQQVCHFTSLLLLSDSRSVLTTLSSALSFLLPQLLWQILHELSFFSSCSIRLQWSLDTRFSRGTTRLMSWPDKERYLSSLHSLVVSLLLSLVSTLLFSQTGGVLPYRNSSTHRFPRFPLRNLCSFVTLAVFSLVYAATDTAYC